MTINGSIQNGIRTLEELFALNIFRIPQYQRAFSWEIDPHLEAFLEDLRQQVRTQRHSPDKQYFLGTFLLHEKNIRDGKKVVDIVDGQQRMTTSVIFIATALTLHENITIPPFKNENTKLLKRYFVYDEDSGSEKFHTITEDDLFFQSHILRSSAATYEQDSPSSRRLKEASDYFKEHVNTEEWESLIHVLKTARVMVYAVNTAEEATQIFELQNDRGKPLTNLEALKSFLMHCTYLHSINSADDRLFRLQNMFSEIYRTIEALTQWRASPGEDQLLANHCAAFCKWSGKEYNDPKHLVKATIKSMDAKEVITWVEIFVSELLRSYRTIKTFFIRRDELNPLSDLLLLGRMGPMWPLILKTWHYDRSEDKHQFLTVCRLLEVFTFRGYAIANLRADTGLSTLHGMARDFTGGFDQLFSELSGMCHDYNLDERFLVGLNSTNFYDEERDALYLLWQYENFLRTQIGKQQSRLSWQDYERPTNSAVKFSVEHIASQADPITETYVSWDQEDKKLFSEIALNRLGNLVIDTFSLNASKGKNNLAGKLKRLSEDSSYLSQGELINFLPDRDKIVWDADAIRKRHKHLIEFAQKRWDPETCNLPNEY